MKTWEKIIQEDGNKGYRRVPHSKMSTFVWLTFPISHSHCRSLNASKLNCFSFWGLIWKRMVSKVQPERPQCLRGSLAESQCSFSNPTHPKGTPNNTRSYLKQYFLGGPWVTQSLKCQALGFSSSHDLRVERSGLPSQLGVCLRVSPSAPPPCPCTCSLSLK